MRKFNQNFACFTNEQDYNALMYGRTNHYIPFKIDCQRDIEIPLYQKQMEEFVLTDYGMFEKLKYGNYLIQILEKHFKLILPFIYYEYTKKTQNSISEQIRKNYQDYLKEYLAFKTCKNSVYPTLKKETILSRMETLEKFAEYYELSAEMREMFNVLDCVNNTFILTKRVVPSAMIPLIKDYIRKIYIYLGLKDEPTFITDEAYISDKTPDNTQNGLIIRDQAILLKDIYFDNDKKIYELLDCLANRGLLSPTIQPSVLNNCCFDYPCKLKSLLRAKCPILFKNCNFSKRFSWPIKHIRYGIVFDNCVFSDTFELTLEANLEVYFNDCIFEEGSKLKLDWSGLNDSKDTLSITDCVFHGGLEVSSKLGMKFIMNNTTFYKPFTTKNMKLKDNSKIINLCFPSNTTEEMESSKKQLHETLIASGLKEMAEGLNLQTTKKKSKDQQIEHKVSQAAIDSGWLSTREAADFLGRSTNYLHKKRMADKKQITRETIPSRGTGKNIRYPVDALIAFKAQDWNKLRELRKKYSKTTHK